MQYGNLGTTGLRVSRMGLGLAALGRPAYINLGHADDLKQNYDPAAMEQHTHAVLDSAWEGGVRYFDAARSYGKAEEFLASWLRNRDIAPDEVTVGSKWGYIYTGEWKIDAETHEVKEHTLEVLQQQWQESQTNLGEYLNLYQIHSATIESGVLENSDVLHELARLKSEGVKIGLTVSGIRQGKILDMAMQVEVEGERLFDSVQVTYNLLEVSVGDALANAHEAGVGVIVKEALANGRLTPRNDDPDFAEKLNLLQQQAERLETTVDALAIAGVLLQPWADIVLSGAATVQQMQSNLKAFDVRWDEEASAKLSSLVEPPEIHWAKRKKLEWK
jgi:aryl-alcohol dehydrogenase-like predicted oxidoreductase